MLAAVLLYDKNTPFPGLAALAPCPDGACIYERGGISIYHDTHHVAISQTGVLDAGLAAVFRPGS